MKAVFQCISHVMTKMFIVEFGHELHAYVIFIFHFGSFISFDLQNPLKMKILKSSFNFVSSASFQDSR